MLASRMGASASSSEMAMIRPKMMQQQQQLNHQEAQQWFDNAQVNLPGQISPASSSSTSASTASTEDFRWWIHENSKLLHDIINKTQNDDVKIKVSNFLELVQASAGVPNAPPVNCFISSTEIEGESGEESSKLQCKIKITLLRERWTAIPLFPDTVALTSSGVTFKSNTFAIDTSAENPFGLAHNRPEKANDKRAEELSPAPAAPTSYCVGVVAKSFCLIASQPGTYTVTLEILVPFATTRMTGFYLNVPKSAQNQMTFKVPEKDVLIKVDPALFSKQYQDEKTGQSCVSCRYPPTTQLSVQWTENKGTNEKKTDQKIEVSATVEQKTLFSVGEGVVLMRTLLSYTIVSGQMSLFEVEIDDRIKVLNVEGMKNFPVKRWEVLSTKTADINSNSSKAKGKGEEGETAGTATLKVWLEYGLEDSYEFTVVSEMEMKSTSCQVRLPCFNCMLSKEVSRDKGYLGIEARTNVEVNEIACNGLAMVDISEIPDALWQMAGNPLLLGYKFLVPSYEITLDVKKHADVGVLIAVIDSAYFTATYSDEGSVLYKLILQVRNTQKQYVRISVPGKFDIWSTVVAGKAVKPATDEKGYVMIPLQKSSKSDSSHDKAFQVEFIYLVNHSAMGSSGDLKVTFPYCDIPINYLAISLYVPEYYIYEECTGMRQVYSFARAPVTDNTWDAYGKQRNNKNRQEESMSSNANVFKTKKRAASIVQMQTGMVHGVLPVRVDTPVTGKEFRFEQLLITEKEKLIEVVVPYRLPEKKKKNSRCC